MDGMMEMTMGDGGKGDWCKGGGKDWGKACGKDDWGKGFGKDDWGKGFGKDWGGGKGKIVLPPWAAGGMEGPYGKGAGKWGPPAAVNPWATNGWSDDYKPGFYYEEPGGKVGIEGLRDAVTRACEPHGGLENKWSKEDMVNKVAMSIFKTSAKWYKEDARHKESGTAIQAQALLEEFTEKIMGALGTTCHDKPWFLEIYLSESIALAAINTFKGGALFKRTVAPIIVTHVDEAIFRYREEERHAVVMWDAVSSVGIKADFLKKANKHLTTSFEAAHISAKYGTSQAATPELGMVQDFVTAWLYEFCKRAWDVLNNGISSSTPESQIAVVAQLFQYLTDPGHSCLPHDLTQQLDAPPPAGWEFIPAATYQVLISQQ